MTDQYKPDCLDAMRSRMLLQRMGDATELSATLVWLVSEAGAFVTGQTIVVDGGVTVT